VAEVLSHDSRAIFTAAAQAQKAADFLHSATASLQEILNPQRADAAI